MSNRIQEINDALHQLELFKLDEKYKDSLYAIEENINFLKSIKTIPGYIKWLFSRGFKLDRRRLLELTDFPVEEWDIKMHKKLIEMQKKDKPGLLNPLVNSIFQFASTQQKDLVIANLGAGGMEADRQVIKKLLKSKLPHKFTFVAIDKSDTTRMIAKNNLSELQDQIEIIEEELLDKKRLEFLRSKTQKNILVILCSNNIFELLSHFSQNYFDLIYHSLFKHHLKNDEHLKLDQILHLLSKHIIEFDGYRNIPIIILQTLVGWDYPHFLNAELFSNFRFSTKQEIQDYAKAKGPVKFYANSGFYLLSLNS